MNIENIFAYPIPSPTGLVVINDRQENDDTPTFKITFGNPDDSTTLSFDWDFILRGVKAIKYSQRNEALLIEAIKNIVRKQNFSELTESLDDNKITEEQYHIELEKNSNKYAITLDNLKSPDDITNIIDLSFRIGNNLREFTVSEVAEMFSVNESVLISGVQASRYHQLVK